MMVRLLLETETDAVVEIRASPPDCCFFHGSVRPIAYECVSAVELVGSQIRSGRVGNLEGQIKSTR